MARELACAGQVAPAGIPAVPLTGGKAGSEVVIHVPGPLDAPDVVTALQAANARLRAQNAGLQAKNAELRAQLAEQIARLERLVSRNSGNSSMPPSADELPGKKPPERRPRRGGGRKPGKQRGLRARAWRGTITRTRS